MQFLKPIGGGVQLPNDVIDKGYRWSTTNLYEPEQIFYSPKHSFTGSEQDFINAGLAYRYVDVDRFTRRVEYTGHDCPL